MIQINNKETDNQSTPQGNNVQPTKKKSALQKKIIFKDAVELPPHSPCRILSHCITPDITLNGSNSTGWQATSNLILKICLVTLSITKNDKNTTTVGKEVNSLTKLIHNIEGDDNKV